MREKRPNTLISPSITYHIRPALQPDSLKSICGLSGTHLMAYSPLIPTESPKSQACITEPSPQDHCKAPIYHLTIPKPLPFQYPIIQLHTHNPGTFHACTRSGSPCKEHVALSATIETIWSFMAPLLCTVGHVGLSPPALNTTLRLSSGLGHAMWTDDRLSKQRGTVVQWHAARDNWATDYSSGGYTWAGLGRTVNGAIFCTEYQERRAKREDQVLALYLPRGRDFTPCERMPDGDGYMDGVDQEKNIASKVEGLKEEWFEHFKEANIRCGEKNPHALQAQATTERTPKVSRREKEGLLGLVGDDLDDETVRHMLLTAVGLEEQILRCKGWNGSYHAW